MQTYPLLMLRETVTALGLTRKYRGRLRLAKPGTALRDSPAGLWEHLATKLPVERSAHGQDIGILLMLLVGAGEKDIRSSLDMMTLMLGWRFDTPDRYMGSAAMRTVDASCDVLEWAGSGVLIAPGRDSDPLDAPGARQLARASVATSVYGACCGGVDGSHRGGSAGSSERGFT